VDLGDLELFAERWLEVSYPNQVKIEGNITPSYVTGKILTRGDDYNGMPYWSYTGGAEYPLIELGYDETGQYVLYYVDATATNSYAWTKSGTEFLGSYEHYTGEEHQESTGTAIVTEYTENTGDTRMITYSSRKMTLDGNTGDRTMTAPYLVLFDYNTGNVVDKTTGVPGASETYAANAITPDGSAVHGESNLWVFTIPPLADIYEYAFRICDAASPAKADASVLGGFLDPKTLMTYTDGLSQGKLRIR
jgi:hypothetical protein